MDQFEALAQANAQAANLNYSSEPNQLNWSRRCNPRDWIQGGIPLHGAVRESQ